MKHGWMAALLALAVFAWPVGQARAADFELQNTMEDAVYGGAIGALVGAGAMLVSGSPTSHWNYLFTGTGIGLIAGALYGVYSSARPLASLEDGRLNLAVPQPSLAAAPNGRELAVDVPLFASRF
ncbi:MAG: hypothetical protein R8K47_04070 [Mariprofundaceae bacterium]